MKKEIESGYMTTIQNNKPNTEDEKGKYLVRFFNNFLGKYCYVADGTIVSWKEEGAIGKEKTVFKTVTSKTSEKYYIKYRINRDTAPRGNDDIDHFLELENGQILATQVVGDFFFHIGKEDFEENIW